MLWGDAQSGVLSAMSSAFGLASRATIPVAQTVDFALWLPRGVPLELARAHRAGRQSSARGQRPAGADRGTWLRALDRGQSGGDQRSRSAICSTEWGLDRRKRLETERFRDCCLLLSSSAPRPPMVATIGWRRVWTSARRGGSMADAGYGPASAGADRFRACAEASAAWYAGIHVALVHSGSRRLSPSCRRRLAQPLADGSRARWTAAGRGRARRATRRRSRASASRPLASASRPS